MNKKLLKVAVGTLILLILLVTFSVGISIKHTRAYLIAEENSLHISGATAYRKVTFGGCHVYRIGESSYFRCEYRLDLFDKGSGNYQADYQNLESGIEADGYSSTMAYGPGSVSGPSDLNISLGIDTWDKKGLSNNENSTLIATPFFQGQGITTPTFQGVYFSPTAPGPALKGSRYVYGVTIRKSFVAIPRW